MTEPHWSTRLVRWWTRRYTAGLDAGTAADRRGEIHSDLVEHERVRRAAGWSTSQLVHERLRRALAGAPADLAWRHERLRARQHPRVAALARPVTTAAQLVLAAYLLAFAAYLLGATSLVDRDVLGRSPLRGFEHYADESNTAIAAMIIGVLGLVLAAAAVARPLSPVVSNAVTFPIAILAVLFFWLGVWPVGAVVLAGAATDLVAGAPRTSAGPMPR